MNLKRTLYKVTAFAVPAVLAAGLILIVISASRTSLFAAGGGRRSRVSSHSRAAVSTHRGSTTAYRGRTAVPTRRVTGVSAASRSAVRHSTVVHSRSYVHRGVVVYRPHGHYYHGYGHYHDDDDAWKWLAFAAITLKVLDNLNEEQQRQHEAAQVQSTTAPVGQPITWSDGNASGSVTTTRQGQDAAGNQCREFQQEVTIGGQTEQAYGTACLQQDGSWKIQE